MILAMSAIFDIRGVSYGLGNAAFFSFAALAPKVATHLWG